EPGRRSHRVSSRLGSFEQAGLKSEADRRTNSSRSYRFSGRTTRSSIARAFGGTRTTSEYVPREFDDSSDRASGRDRDYDDPEPFGKDRENPAQRDARFRARERTWPQRPR